MMEELRNKLPEELVWNVVKYLQHPLAELIQDDAMCGVCNDLIPLHHKCDYCKNRFCVRHTDYEKVIKTSGDYLACIECLFNRFDEFLDLTKTDKFVRFHRGLFDHVRCEIRDNYDGDVG